MKFLDFLKYINAKQDGFLYRNKLNGTNLLYNPITNNLTYYNTHKLYYCSPNIKTIYDFMSIKDSLIQYSYQQKYREYILQDLLYS
jgi:hypothetical protein